jgi:drug/metabolite transporter (DMT)-like permease
MALSEQASEQRMTARRAQWRSETGAITVARAITLVLWASGFAAIRAAVEGYSAGQMALLRFLIASCVLAIVAGVRRMSLPRPADLPAIVLIGVTGFVAYNLLLAAGEKTVSASAASLLVNTAPIFTALLATVLLRERFGWQGWAGSAIGFAGAAVIALGTGQGFTIGRGAILVLGAAAAQACYFVTQKPLLARYRSLDLVTYAIWVGTLLLLPFLPGLTGAVRTASPQATGAVVFLGIFPSAVGHTAWAWALARSPAGRSANFLYLSPILAVVVAWLWLGERPAPITLLGGLLAVGGVVLLSARRRVPELSRNTEPAMMVERKGNV